MKVSAFVLPLKTNLLHKSAEYSCVKDILRKSQMELLFCCKQVGPSHFSAICKPNPLSMGILRTRGVLSGRIGLVVSSDSFQFSKNLKIQLQLPVKSSLLLREGLLAEGKEVCSL